ncbi:MAG: LysR family transcriptional regulator [Chloroflexi bacterium]|nr:LysR family transcriptional regulator [Chloroflexota bacterium]
MTSDTQGHKPDRYYREDRYYKENVPQQLRGFYHVAMTHSFTAAARQMSLEQPTITLQVRALERWLQVRLFDRRKGDVTLTPEGEALFELAAPVVRALESIKGAFQERLGEIATGKVVCAATEDFVLYLLPGVVHDFSAKFTGVDVELLSANSQSVLQMVVRGDAELGIGAPIQKPSSIEFLPLVSYSQCLVVPPEHPLAGLSAVSLEEAVKYPLIAPREGGMLWHTIRQALESRHLQWQIAVRLAGTEARLRYVQLGLGVTITSAVGLAYDIAPRLAWIPMVDSLPTTVYGLITRKNTYLSLPAKKFAEFVTAAAASFTSPELFCRGSTPSA